MKQIIRLIPVKRQSMLFSATQTRNVEDLARISLQQAPLYVGVDDTRDMATTDGLEQVLHSESNNAIRAYDMLHNTSGIKRRGKLKVISPQLM